MASAQDERRVVKRHIVWLCAGCDQCEPAGVEDKSSMPCTNSPSSNGGVVVEVKDLLAWENIAQLAAYLPLQKHCVCEEEWDSDSEMWSVDEDACTCHRLLHVAVRNSLASLLGEPQISAAEGIDAIAESEGGPSGG